MAEFEVCNKMKFPLKNALSENEYYTMLGFRFRIHNEPEKSFQLDQEFLNLGPVTKQDVEWAYDKTEKMPVVNHPEQIKNITIDQIKTGFNICGNTRSYLTTEVEHVLDYLNQKNNDFCFDEGILKIKDAETNFGSCRIQQAVDAIERLGASLEIASKVIAEVIIELISIKDEPNDEAKLWCQLSKV